MTSLPTLLTLPPELIGEILLGVPSPGQMRWGGRSSIVPVLVVSVPALPTLRLVCRCFRDVIDGEMALESNRVRWEVERIWHTAVTYDDDVVRRLPLLTLVYLLHNRNASSSIIREQYYARKMMSTVRSMIQILVAGAAPTVRHLDDQVATWLMCDTVHSAHPHWMSLLVDVFGVLKTVALPSECLNMQTTTVQAEALVHAVIGRPPRSCRFIMDLCLNYARCGIMWPTCQSWSIFHTLLFHCPKLGVSADECDAFITWAANEWNTHAPARGRTLVDAEALVKQYGVVRRQIPWKQSE